MAPKILILDGGLGTSLEQSHGIKFTSSDSPLWSASLLVTDPSTLLACQSSFGAVPVDVILTATYQVSIKGFKGTKTEQRPDGYGREEIGGFVDDSVRIAREALDTRTSGGKGAVALSVGPYGACMIPGQEYSGAYDETCDDLQKLEDWHTERLAIMGEPEGIASKLGYVALETIPRLDEIVAMRKALASTPSLSSLPYWTACLFPDPALNTLPDGSSVAAAVRAMLDPSISPNIPWGIGINCTKIHKLDSLLQEFEAAVSDLVSEGVAKEWPALILYPDGTNGEVYDTTTQTWNLPANGGFPPIGKPWEEVLKNIVKATAKRGQWPTVLVGGCCMANAGHIKKLKHTLDNSL